MSKASLPFSPRAQRGKIDKSALALQPGVKQAPVRREGDSAKHLVFVRGLPCLAAVAFGSDPTTEPRSGEAHHLLTETGKPMGGKSPDRWTVPLAHVRHLDLHRLGERRYFEAIGIADPKAVASALWERSGDRAAALAWLEANVRGRAQT